MKAASSAGAEMLELRLDYLEGLSAEMTRALVGRAKASGVPVIVTCRDEQEGGARAYPMKLRIEVLKAAMEAGAEYIDFEYENFRSIESQERLRVALSRSSKGRLILSAHNFEGRFTDIKRLYRDIEGVFAPAIPKLVYAANHINDCFEAFDLLHQTSGDRIVLCMGQAGLISRILAKKLGSMVTFASAEKGSATAPGQLTAGQLRALYRYDALGPKTGLFGVIADPVGHSLSPAIHNACFERAGMDRLYLPLRVEGGRAEFEAFMRGVTARKWLGFGGFSVTIPHKRNALEYVLAEKGFAEPLAVKIGAVNTLLVSGDGRLKAYNTDYAGALDAITAGMGIGRDGLRGLAVAVVGAGGVARAIVAGLSDAGADITIYNRTIEKAERLAGEFGCRYAALGELANMDARLVVNCTSVGMHPDVDDTPVPDGCLREGVTVFDTVYNPAETLLLRQARYGGAKTIDGVSMFVNQAMAQFRLFTGEAGDAQLMRKTVVGNLPKHGLRGEKN
jgi:3-dehydroquinate dehydratase/shikimate dehydrogenase